MNFKVFCFDGQRIPDYYGDAYYDYTRQAWVCMPIPVNYVVWLYWKIYDWFRWELKRPQIHLEREKIVLHSDALKFEYWHGYNKGYRDAMFYKDHEADVMGKLGDCQKEFKEYKTY